MAHTPMRERMQSLAHDTQAAICTAIETLDGTCFHEDRWQRPGGGGGTSRVLQDGNVFEKAGVNVSVVHGTLSRDAARSMAEGRFAEQEGLAFFATGVSVVLHPHNPMAPTAHCNYRYFELDHPTAEGAWWFGGSSDLTPAYLFEEDARHFHRMHREACDRHDPAYYPQFKKACDEYFVVPHRGERRGIGGIFFDDLHQEDPEALYALTSDCAGAFVPAYVPLVERRKDLPFTEDHKRWQSLRRGRYVEFNLLYDRGTTFGLKTGGRVESILMSLPLVARWEYDHVPEQGSPEEQLLDVLRSPRQWA